MGGGAGWGGGWIALDVFEAQEGTKKQKTAWYGRRGKLARLGGLGGETRRIKDASYMRQKSRVEHVFLAREQNTRIPQQNTAKSTSRGIAHGDRNHSGGNIYS